MHNAKRIDNFNIDKAVVGPMVLDGLIHIKNNMIINIDVNIYININIKLSLIMHMVIKNISTYIYIYI